MLLIRKSLSRALLFQKRYFSTEINPQEIASNTSFFFNPTLDALERVDAKFQTGKSINNEIIGDKDQILKVKQIYVQLFKALSGSIRLDELKGQIEPRLLTEIDENLNFLKDNNLKIGVHGSSLFAKSEADMLKKLDTSHIGYLKVLDANIERNKNLFIHEYDIERTDDRLLYTPKEDPAFKDMPTSRKQKMQQEMVEALKEKKEHKPVKDAVMWTAKKLGFMTPDELKQPPKFLMNIVNFKDRLYGSVEGEDHILVEDYEILSPLGLYIQNIKTKEIIKSEGKDGESFRHFLRVERIYENRDAPSVRKAKPILLVDFDFMLRGNPHTLVKNFAGC